MKNNKIRDDIALCKRIVQVMADILADKYDCIIRVKFKDEEPDDGGSKDESKSGEDDHALYGNGT